MRELANVNYQKELEKLIEQHEKEGKVPRLFLHACCAPCSSYVLEYLSRFFSVTVFFYNPNISPKEEYEKRVAEIRRLISEMEFLHPVDLVEGAYRPEDFYAMAFPSFPAKFHEFFNIFIPKARCLRILQKYTLKYYRNLTNSF